MLERTQRLWESQDRHVDVDRRADRFFADTDGIGELLRLHDADPDARAVQPWHRSTTGTGYGQWSCPAGGYTVSTAKLDSYLVPKRVIEVTREYLHETGRGIGYTKSPFAYLFERVC